MQQHAQTSLFALLSQEFDVQALQTDMQEIERIVCADDVALLRVVRNELASLYQRTRRPNELLLQGIDERLSQFPLPPGQRLNKKATTLTGQKQRPNGKPFCQYCGSRHNDRPLFTARPPTDDDKLCAVCSNKGFAIVDDAANQEPDHHGGRKNTLSDEGGGAEKRL